MNPFPGVNSVLIIDNCSVHHGGNVQKLCDEHGMLNLVKLIIAMSSKF
jgi:hypothetical protein